MGKNDSTLGDWLVRLKDRSYRAAPSAGERHLLHDDAVRTIDYGSSGNPARLGLSDGNGTSQ